MQTIKRALERIKGWIEMETQVLLSAEIAHWAPGNRGSGCMDSVAAGIWPREIKGKAEDGSVILGIQNEYLGRWKHRTEQEKRSRRSEEEHREAVQDLKIEQDAT